MVGCEGQGHKELAWMWSMAEADLGNHELQYGHTWQSLESTSCGWISLYAQAPWLIEHPSLFGLKGERFGSRMSMNDDDPQESLLRLFI